MCLKQFVECALRLHFRVILETNDSKASARSCKTNQTFFRRLYVKRGKLSVGCSFAMLPVAKSAQMLPWYRLGLTNLRHACPQWHAERFPWHAEFTVVPLFLISLPRPVTICCEEYVCVYIWGARWYSG